jgi:hypothetical protein
LSIGEHECRLRRKYFLRIAMLLWKKDLLEVRKRAVVEGECMSVARRMLVVAEGFLAPVRGWVVRALPVVSVMSWGVHG